MPLADSAGNTITDAVYIRDTYPLVYDRKTVEEAARNGKLQEFKITKENVREKIVPAKSLQSFLEFSTKNPTLTLQIFAKKPEEKNPYREINGRYLNCSNLENIFSLQLPSFPQNPVVLLDDGSTWEQKTIEEWSKHKNLPAIYSPDTQEPVQYPIIYDDFVKHVYDSIESQATQPIKNGEETVTIDLKKILENYQPKAPTLAKMASIAPVGTLDWKSFIALGFITISQGVMAYGYANILVAGLLQQTPALSYLLCAGHWLYSVKMAVDLLRHANSRIAANINDNPFFSHFISMVILFNTLKTVASLEISRMDVLQLYTAAALFSESLLLTGASSVTQHMINTSWQNLANFTPAQNVVAAFAGFCACYIASLELTKSLDFIDTNRIGGQIFNAFSGLWIWFIEPTYRSLRAGQQNAPMFLLLNQWGNFVPFIKILPLAAVTTIAFNYLRVFINLYYTLVSASPRPERNLSTTISGIGQACFVLLPVLIKIQLHTTDFLALICIAVTYFLQSQTPYALKQIHNGLKLPALPKFFRLTNPSEAKRELSPAASLTPARN